MRFSRLHTVLPALASVAVVGALAATTAGPAGAAPAPATDRAWSPEGRVVSFSREPGHDGVVVSDADGSAPRLTVPVATQDVRGSIVITDTQPRTGVILWTTTVGQQYGYPLVTHQATDVHGDDLGTWTIPGSTDNAAAISPDGRSVTYTWSGRQAQPGDPSVPPPAPAQLLRAHADGTTEVVRDLGFDANGPVGLTDVATDGRIAVYEWRGPTPGPHVVSPQGGSDRALPAPSGFSWPTWTRSVPLWSPDGSRLAVVAQDAQGSQHLLVIDASDGRLVRDLGGASATAWSPDGTTLLASAADQGQVLLDVATGDARPAPSSFAGWVGLGQVTGDTDGPRIGVRAIASAPAPQLPADLVVGGRTSDVGTSGVRYVVVTAVRQRGPHWTALVGRGDDATWQRFDTARAARRGATERQAAVLHGRTWQISLPDVRAGRLTVTAKAADWAGNETSVARETRLR